MVVKTIKLNRNQQRDLLMVTVLFSIAIMGLINIFWEPMIFMIVVSYAILNKDRRITKNEMLMIAAVKVWLFYAIIARLFGMGPGMFIAFFLVVIVIFSYVFIWRKTR